MLGFKLTFLQAARLLLMLANGWRSVSLRRCCRIKTSGTNRYLVALKTDRRAAKIAVKLY